MNELIQFLSDLGIHTDQILCDGKIHRVGKDKKKSQWYIAHMNFTRKTGQEFYVIIAGDWRTNETSTLCTLTDQLSVDDKKVLKAQIDKARKKQEAFKLQQQDKVAQEVQQRWTKIDTDGTSPYLEKKKIATCDNLGIRFDHGNIYVPMRDIVGKVWSLQKIQPDGGKFFQPGGRVQGCYHSIGSLKNSDMILVTEGFATAASLHMATGLGVVIAFNAGNMPIVASEVKRLYPNKTFLICGDNDLWTTRKIDGEDQPYNAGKIKGEEAAKKCLGKLIMPQFESLDQHPTDFNDLHCLESIEAVTNQVVTTHVERATVFALGFCDGDYFYTSSQNPCVVKISQFSEKNFLELMPLHYWESLYPGSGQARIDWSEARSDLMEQARKRGIFEHRHVRGSGVWSDQGRVVVNMGDHLLVNGELLGLDQIKSRFFYTLGKKLPNIHANPLNHKECDLLLQICSSFKWIKPDYSFLMAGGLVTAKLCGALPVRPHLWITGSAQTGKSTLLEKLVHPVIGTTSLYFQGGTTEAGIRQSLKADAVPIQFDEFETTGHRTSDNVRAIVELMRSSWSETSAHIAKGSSSGTANAYQVRFSAIVSSIRVNLTNDADRSRFAVLELAPHGNDEQHWLKLKGLLDQLDEEYVDRLFARTLKMLPVMMQNFRALKSAFAQRVSQRFGDQYGMLLAGYSILMSDDPLTTDEARTLAEHVKLEDERQEAVVTDQLDCLRELLDRKVVLDFAGQREERLIGEALRAAINRPSYAEAIERYGVAVTSDSFHVSCRHPELKKAVFANTRWSDGWDKSLLRLEGSCRARHRIAGSQPRTVKVPMRYLTDM